MIFYKIKLNNIFQFENFELDMTYARESVHSPISQAHKKYNNLKYKKFLLLLGANASGKTTLGKSLCIIQNFLAGKELINSELFDFKKHFSFNPDKNIELSSVFSTKNHMYMFEIEISSKGMIKELWKRINLKNLSYNKHEKELLDSEYIYFNENINSVFSSSLLKSIDHVEDKSEIQEDLGFVYSFSDEKNETINTNVGFNIQIFEKLLMSFDNSIQKVFQSSEVDNNKIIEFKNGYKEIVLENGIISDDKNSILSSGTKEVIYLSYMLTGLFNANYHTLYFDEKMTNSHSEIEQQIIQIIITMVDRIDGQVFITSHNSDILNMAFPNYNYMLLKKNGSGTITESIHPEKYLKHNNRTLRKLVEDDIFSTAPILDDLLTLHNSLFEGEE